ncbi:group 1 glycosyl transferase [Novosphingobium sp. Rr 2-17]|uniref:glycosyltransferase family 4 protein n=1 Tax=Novosphingobium sp. Rr 2-17 TaxID=555793 RepID=UPI0002699B93|nr:glycosyltransferase [Novosphingobium sp. Rr 2-17]EIZ79792.1 group 1 glycosyl transferase [Novosphingobium sp. Rr 2-17]
MLKRERKNKANVAILYHMWPHYRSAVMTSLDESDIINYTFVGDNNEIEGINFADPQIVTRFRHVSYRKWRQWFWQTGAIAFALNKDWDALIFLGNPNFLSTWLAAALARLRGTPVLFWEHGWRRKEGRLKSAFRLAFFRLADRVLVYSPRAKILGTIAGYPADKIDVVWNSLDTKKARQLYYRIESGSLNNVDPRMLFDEPSIPLLLCSARITPLCRFDLLISAAAVLRKEGFPCNILLVGDGPSVGGLKKLAEDLCQPVHFYGACYDETVISQITYKSDLTISPGKVGLTAMQSLMYGTPVITHDNDDQQMPEVEAIRSNVTGNRFRQDDVNDLARVIREWISTATPRHIIRKACISEIDAHWNPDMQARIIDNAVTMALKK